MRPATLDRLPMELGTIAWCYVRIKENYRTYTSCMKGVDALGALHLDQVRMRRSGTADRFPTNAVVLAKSLSREKPSSYLVNVLIGLIQCIS